MINKIVRYEVECDEPGCTFDTGSLGGDQVAEESPTYAVEDWLEAGEQAIDNPDGPQFHYCHKHERHIS